MEIDNNVEKIISLLIKNKNVILMGPPATGKSILMAKVAERFLDSSSAGVDFKVRTEVLFPPKPSKSSKSMPSPSRLNRNILSITFHQNTKHRQFVSGIVPRLGDGESGFQITKGVLVEANQYAIGENGSVLLLIDEINRGPAVSIFGDTLTAIEIDKRLDDSDNVTSTSVPFQTYDNTTGNLDNQYLSPHVYILASMNEADTSVEPLDVAFLRRFAVVRLEPDVEIVYLLLGVSATTPDVSEPGTSEHVYSRLIKAWVAVNERISIGRSSAFQLGHGVLLRGTPPTELSEALAYASECWLRIETHIREVFFGSEISQSVVFNSKSNGYYELKDVEFGDQSFSKLVFHPWNADVIFALLMDITSDSSGEN